MDVDHGFANPVSNDDEAVDDCLILPAGCDRVFTAKQWSRQAMTLRALQAEELAVAPVSQGAAMKVMAKQEVAPIDQGAAMK